MDKIVPRIYKLLIILECTSNTFEGQCMHNQQQQKVIHHFSILSWAKISALCTLYAMSYNSGSRMGYLGQMPPSLCGVASHAL